MRHAPVGSLPYGLQKRVDLGRALAMEPDLLLLDEPMAGMSVEEKHDMSRFIIEANDALGATVVLIEHDVSVVMDLVHNNTQIKRTVTKLPDGIRTVTESDDPKVAQAIKAHVASMSSRLKDGREFNIFSTTLPVIFDNADKIKSVVEMTDKGAVVTRTASDSKVAYAQNAALSVAQSAATHVTSAVRPGGSPLQMLGQAADSTDRIASLIQQATASGGAN